MPLRPNDKVTSELDVMGRVLHFGRQLAAMIPWDIEWCLVLRLRGGGQRAYFGGTGNDTDQRQLLAEAARNEQSKPQVILGA